MIAAGTESALLDALRTACGDPRAEFEAPPVALTGGYETTTLAFRLRSDDPRWARPLVLRIFERGVPSAAVGAEVAAMSIARARGFPGPEVLAVWAEPGELGAPAILMERLSGRPMFDALFPARLPTLVPTLAALQARLHSIGLDGAGVEPIPSYGDQLVALDERIGRARLAGLRDGFAWVREHATSPASLVLCHGDFHPLNIMMDADYNVTGVIDWSLVTVAEPEFDVGCTRMLMAYAPVDAGVFSGALGLFQRSVLARRYYSRYRSLRTVDDERVRYYEAFRCLRSLAWAGESARASAPGRAGPWGSPAVAKRLIRHFHRATGVAVSL